MIVACVCCDDNRLPRRVKLNNNSKKDSGKRGPEEGGGRSLGSAVLKVAVHKEECPDQGWTPGEPDHRGLDNREVKPYRCFCSPAELCSLRGSGGRGAGEGGEDEPDCRVSSEIQGRCGSGRSAVTSMTTRTTAGVRCS